MKIRMVVLMHLLLCVVVMYGGSAAFAQRNGGEMGAFFTGESLPMPPGQNAKWEHSDNPLANAAAALFEQGLANPQGLEYREIEIAVGDPWSGGGGLVKTHGWILPPEAGREDRFAVAWNGLVYPVARIGDVADLREDWARDDAEAVEEFRRGSDEAMEMPSVSYRSPTLLKMALLLRLGETEIVHRYDSIIALRKPADLYCNMARDWVWFAFARAVCAHQRGDDRLARADARMLTRVSPLIEAEAVRRGFKIEPALVSSRDPNSAKLLWSVAGQLPALLADAERRVAAPRKPPSPAAPSIAALIDNLETVFVGQDGQPGGVSLAQAAWVQALVQRGPEVVEPLLEAMVSDTRLTRSVSFGRDFRRNRHLIPVSSAAFAALTDLLQVDFKTYDEKGRLYSRQELADQIRAYWKDKGALSPAERFYATLRDDQAGKDQWMQAVRNIVQPDNVRTQGRWTVTTPPQPGEKIQMRGEILRDGREPSVSQLLAQRSDDLAAVTPDSRNDRSRAIDAGQLAIHLAAWDKAAAISVLQRRLDRAWKMRADHNDVPALMSIARMTLAVAEAGDEAAYDEYADWIQKLDLKGIMYYGGEILQPLIRGAARPRVIQATIYLFNDPRSPWSSLMAGQGQDSIARFPDFWRTPLPLTLGFRRQALRGLSEKSIAGTITFYPPEKWDSQTEASIGIGGLGMGYRGSNGDPDTPPPGEKREFRVCDIYAYSYARDQGGPAFQLFWPEAKRDAGVAACRVWLEAKK